MKRILLVLTVLIAIWLVSARPAHAAENNRPLADPGVLCLPGIYLLAPGDCNPMGPSVTLTQLAENGFTFPKKPLNFSRPDTSLTYVDYRYGFVKNRNAPVYASVDDALKGNKREAAQRLDSSFTYISYTEEVMESGRRFYMIDPGAWMTANDVVRIGAVPLFQGVTFEHTPEQAFGWILTYLNPTGPVETKRTPGTDNQDYTGRFLNNHEIVQVYAAQKVGEDDWYMIGPEEWVHQYVVARVIPNTTPPPGVQGDRWIEVNLFEQTIAVYQNRQLVFATLIASGLEPFWTRPGTFQIYQKLETTPMRGAFEADRSDAYYLEDVPWTMYFDEARALHGAYWRANLGFPQSHGCVNLSVGDSRWIFDWANLGDYVYVWDPSGETPVDPSAYGAGGA